MELKAWCAAGVWFAPTLVTAGADCIANPQSEWKSAAEARVRIARSNEAPQEIPPAKHIEKALLPSASRSAVTWNW